MAACVASKGISNDLDRSGKAGKGEGSAKRKSTRMNRHPFWGHSKKQMNKKRKTDNKSTDGVTIWQETCWKIHFHVFLSLMSQKRN